MAYVVTPVVDIDNRLVTLEGFGVPEKHDGSHPETIRIRVLWGALY